MMGVGDGDVGAMMSEMMSMWFAQMRAGTNGSGTSSNFSNYEYSDAFNDLEWLPIAHWEDSRSNQVAVDVNILNCILTSLKFSLQGVPFTI